LHRGLIEELKISGPLEEDIVMAIARYMWRKRNLKTYRAIELAKKSHDQLLTTLITRSDIPRDIVRNVLRNNKTAHPEIPIPLLTKENVARVNTLYKEVAKQMGEQNVELALIANQLTIDNLQNELLLTDRLDGMIDRAIKRLLMIRGIKSLATACEGVPNQPLSTT
jgi:hypothetical protein